METPLATIPKGLHLSAQGCEERATLGVRAQYTPNPERVESGHPVLALWVIGPATYCGAVRTSLVAKRLECAELAPAFRPPAINDSASKLDALQTLRATGMS